MFRVKVCLLWDSFSFVCVPFELFSFMEIKDNNDIEIKCGIHSSSNESSSEMEHSTQK